MWTQAEELGLDHAWTLDHLSWRSLRDRPWFDAMTTMCAAACATGRMGLGTLVTSPNFRHPVVTARQAMTLDHVSAGRFVLGIGAGAGGPDATALGAREPRPAVRAERFEEFVTLTDALLRQAVTSFAGEHFQADDVRMIPGCVQRPRLPLALAAAGPRGMRLVARFADIWVTIGDPSAPGCHSEGEAFATLRRQMNSLATACELAGRSHRSLRKLVNLSRVVVAPYSSPHRLADLVGRCGDLGFTDVVLAYPRPDGVFAGDACEFEKAVAHVAGPANWNRSI